MQNYMQHIHQYLLLLIYVRFLMLAKMLGSSSGSCNNNQYSNIVICFNYQMTDLFSSVRPQIFQYNMARLQFFQLKILVSCGAKT